MNHIKLLRIKANIDIEYAAKQLKIKSLTLKRYEEGVRKPSVKVGLRMSIIYKCALEDIYKPYYYKEV